MFTDLDWLVATLRVKTICWEHFERQGIKVNAGAAQDINFSGNATYIKHFKQKALNEGKTFLHDIYKRFKNDSNIGRVKKRGNERLSRCMF